MPIENAQTLSVGLLILY